MTLTQNRSVIIKSEIRISKSLPSPERLRVGRRNKSKISMNKFQKPLTTPSPHRGEDEGEGVSF
jgi:hypothetical protein